MDRDYTRLIPDTAPPGMLQWLKESGVWKEDWLIFKTDYIREPITGMKHMTRKCWCSACGSWMHLDCATDSLGRPAIGYMKDGKWERVHSWEYMNCPECGANVKALHTESICGAREYKWAMSFDRVPSDKEGAPDRLVLLFWRAKRYASYGDLHSGAEKYEAYVVEEKKIIRLTAWGRLFYSTYTRENWVQTKSFADVIRDVDLVYAPGGIDAAIRGTTAENSKLDLYLREGATIGPVDDAWERRAVEAPAPTGDKKPERPVVFPVAYLRAWQKWPNIETILQTGGGQLLAEVILKEKTGWNDSNWHGYRGGYNTYIPKLETMDKKKRRPCEILRMNREKYRQFVQAGYGERELTALMLGRANGIELKIPEDLAGIGEFSEEELRRLSEKKVKWNLAARYLAAQGRRYPEEKEKNLLTPGELCDYLTMAEKAGADLRDYDVRWPQHLTAAHAVMVTKCQFNEDPELRKLFTKRCKKLSALSWEHEGILIRPPKTESEMIAEGKVLHHCVATYARRHAEGKTAILFVRRAEEPDVPWYTLNLDEKGGYVIQNRGRNNCARTKEVQAFEDAWLAWIREGCPREKENTGRRGDGTYEPEERRETA